MSEDNNDLKSNTIELATEITIAWLSNPNNRAGSDDVPAFFEQMHRKIDALANTATAAPSEEVEAFQPAVPVRSSVKPDYLISLIDGRKFKSLKRHLSQNGLTPDEYRTRYGLKSDYPMVAASYSAERRAVAQRLGLGRKPGATRSSSAADAAPKTPRPVGRPKKASTEAAAEKPARAKRGLSFKSDDAAADA